MCVLNGILLSLQVSVSHTTTHHSKYDSPRREISSSQRPLPDNTQQTNNHAFGGIRTHNLSRQAAADLCLRPSSHWNRLITTITHVYLLSKFLYQNFLCFSSIGQSFWCKLDKWPFLRYTGNCKYQVRQVILFTSPRKKAAIGRQKKCLFTEYLFLGIIQGSMLHKSYIKRVFPTSLSDTFFAPINV